jgi:acetyl-CoA carboxylase carboxyltransferase component
MGGQQAAGTLLTVRQEALRARGQAMSAEEQASFAAGILATYEREGSPYYSTARLWDDGVIDPADTRQVLALGIAAALSAPIEPTTFGVFRM